MGTILGSATTEINAPIADVYRVAADVENSPKWQPELKEVEVLERDADGKQVLVRTVADLKVRALSSNLRFTYSEPTALSWVQESGDLSAVAGSWAFEDLGDGRTRATYELSVELGRMLGLVIRGPLVDLAREALAGSMPGKLKGAVEGEQS